jgi:hypothetical protein
MFGWRLKEVLCKLLILAIRNRGFCVNFWGLSEIGSRLIQLGVATTCARTCLLPSLRTDSGSGGGHGLPSSQLRAPRGARAKVKGSGSQMTAWTKISNPSPRWMDIIDETVSNLFIPTPAGFEEKAWCYGRRRIRELAPWRRRL